MSYEFDFADVFAAWPELLQGLFNSLVLSALAFIGVWEHQRIRSKPAFQQSLIVFFALALYEFLLFVVDAWTGHPNTDVRRWLHILPGAMIWPIAIALLERGHSPR